MAHRAIRSSLLALFLASSVTSEASRARAVVLEDSLSLTFIADGVRATDAMVDAGTIRNQRRNGRDSAVVSRRFSVRLDRKSGERGGTATLRAFLATSDVHCIYRVDGILLSTNPVAIDRLMPIGREISHWLEIEIPASAPAGTLFTTIEWELTSD